MFIPVFVGALSGVVGTMCWIVIQFALSASGLHARLADSWWVVPPILGVVTAGLHTIARALQSRGGDRSIHPTRLDRRRALADVFESYHFGIFVLHPFNWLARGIVSLLNAFLGGTFGVEGGVLELSFATLPLLSRYARLFIEEKQTFVICTIAASLSVALGAPFSGALIALELAHVLEPRVRVGAVLAALTAYGTAMLLQSTLFAAFLAESSLEKLNVLAVLFSGLRPLNLEFSQWALLSTASVCVGLGAGLVAIVTSRVLDFASEYFSNVFSGRFRTGMIVVGLLMGVSVWLVPGSFVEPWRSWEELAWLRISTGKTLTLLVAEWTLLVLAFAGWGSSGVFSPALLLGALFGYGVGNAIGSTWALPLAIAGSVSAFSAMFRTPISAAALVLEVGRDGPMWWLSTLAVVSSSLLCRALDAKPLHQILLDRMGLRVVGGRAVNVLASLKTSDAMLSDVATITENAGISEMRAAASGSTHNFLGVISSEGKYVGLLPLEQLPGKVRQVLRPDANLSEVASIERVLEIRDLIDSLAPTVEPDDSLEAALELLEDAPCVAVVDRERNLKGFLFESAVAGVYKRQIAGTVIKGSLIKG